MKTAATFLCFLGFSYILGVSCVDDVYERLWKMNEGIANETLNLDFLRQMENGTLQAERYVNFTIQDIGYLLKVTNMLKIMSLDPSLPADIKKFMKGRFTSYKKFADYMLKVYFFKTKPGILQTPAMRKYLSFYKTVMENEKPIYFAVSLLPCSRLWVWLANNLNIPSTSPYYTWKMDNKDGHPENHYRDLLNKYLDTPVKVLKAAAIFRIQMQNEHDFFSTS